MDQTTAAQRPRTAAGHGRAAVAGRDHQRRPALKLPECSSGISVQ
jgi:hypothetical protein